MSPSKPTIAYVCQIFPLLTETFIYREILALQQLGYRVITLSNHRPIPNQISEDSKGLIEQTTYFYPVNWHRLLTTHAYFLLTTPHKYLGTLLFLLTRPEESKQNRWRTLRHFVGAVYLAAEAKRQGVSHLHAHMAINAATMALVIARLLDIEFSFTVHNTFFTDKIVLREKLRAAKFIVSISEYSRNYLLNYDPADATLPERVRIIHCGIPVETFTPARPAMEVENEPPVILAIGQLAPRKGMPYLVEACRILAEQGHDFICRIAGDGPQFEQLQHMITEYSLHGKVELLGRVLQEDLPTSIQQADISVLACITTETGDRDGIPAGLMESMAAELPVVSTTVSGIPELIDHEINGLLVPEKDAPALAAALARLLTEPALRQQLGQNGRRKIINEFNMDKSATQLAHLFEQYI